MRQILIALLAVTAVLILPPVGAPQAAGPGEHSLVSGHWPGIYRDEFGIPVTTAIPRDVAGPLGSRRRF